MSYRSVAGGRSRAATGSWDQFDRILAGSCALAWLAALGAGVAATVALVRLAEERPEAPDNAGTPWLLYTVIVVSALVILGAIPLLWRARKTALPGARPARRAPETQDAVRGVEGPTAKLGLSGTAERRGVGPSARRAPAGLVTAVDRLLLRCALGLGCAMGAATLATAVATHLLAVDNNGLAWAFYGVAGLVTVGMAAIPWFYLRELHDVHDAFTR